MPHVVLTGAIMLRDVFEKLDSFIIRDEKKILKTSDKYINSNENSILVEAMAIEDNNKASFLVLLSRREDGLVIRIYPDSNVEKTEGVKRILAKIAKQLLEKFPSLRIGKTNLQDFL